MLLCVVGKECVVERGMRSVDGKVFPVLKKEEKGKDSTPRMFNAGSKNILEIHGDIAGLGKESLEMYLENMKRSGGGEIKEMTIDTNPPRIAFQESEGEACMFYYVVEIIRMLPYTVE